jgi:hypothetical protein
MRMVTSMIPRILLGVVLVVLAVLPFNLTGSASSAGGAGPIVQGAQAGKGTSNQASGKNATIGGGSSNLAGGINATIGGGNSNQTSGNNATIGGGVSNTASLGATVAGGADNNASDNATISGGFLNTASGNQSVIAGGSNNQATSPSTFIGGGKVNSASANFAVIGGGASNTASGASATVCGGLTNTASGSNSIVAGGLGNTAGGDFSFAAGKQALIVKQHAGAFVFADSTGTPFSSTAANEFAVRASGGLRFVTAAGGNAGVRLAPGSGAWSSLSDRNSKTNFAPTDGPGVLARLAGLPIQTWNYRTQDVGIRHMGPTAQDFHTAFGIGEDDRHISTIDADGVALAAIQQLYRISQQKDKQIADLAVRLKEKTRDIDELRARLTRIEQAVTRKCKEREK